MTLQSRKAITWLYNASLLAELDLEGTETLLASASLY